MSFILVTVRGVHPRTFTAANKCHLPEEDPRCPDFRPDVSHQESASFLGR